MAARHGLQVILRIPIRIEDDGGIRGRERDAHAARPSREQVREPRARSVESIDARLAIFRGRITI